MGEFSEDLSKGVFRALSPLSDEPNAAEQRNLYLRTDLRTPGAGTYELLTRPAAFIPAPAEFSDGNPTLADASQDFGQVLFESELNLTADAGGDMPKLYEWDHGALRLAGILPDGECGFPPCVAESSAAGRGARGSGFSYTQGTISDDGSRVFFTSPVDSSGDPTPDSQLYMRTDHTSTVRLSASEKTIPSPTPGLVRFDAATQDGSKVLFTSEGGAGLYMYDASKPDSAPDNLSLIAAGDITGVVGISEDAGYVYFIGQGELAPGGAGRHRAEPLPLARRHDPLHRHLCSVRRGGDDDDEHELCFDLRT